MPRHGKKCARNAKATKPGYTAIGVRGARAHRKGQLHRLGFPKSNAFFLNSNRGFPAADAMLGLRKHPALDKKNERQPQHERYGFYR